MAVATTEAPVKISVDDLNPSSVANSSFTGQRQLPNHPTNIALPDDRRLRSLDRQVSSGSTESSEASERRAGGEGSETEGSRPGSSKPRGMKGAGGTLPATVRFHSGNPSVEVTEGILHLCKDDRTTPVTDGVVKSEMICILNVPATLTSQDLLMFLAPLRSGLEHVKIIRGSSPNEYMVLLKFRALVYADELYRAYNNRPFNSIEPEICHLAYVARVEIVRASEECLSFPGVTELPVCTVCLEKMDESIDCILTILCNHCFHSACLMKWDDTSCPVCRYIQTPVAVADNKCFQCSSQENLWMCLICGVVGCGRNDGGHAYDHFKVTSHTYSMQLGSNRVWDYAGDNYVHRLVQNKTDGKMVQVDEGGFIVHEEKVDSLALEYTYLLTSQLETQRHHFEERLEQIDRHRDKRMEELGAQLKAILSDSTKKDQLLATVAKDKQVLERRCILLQTKVSNLTKDVEDEREMNRCLHDNQTELQARITTLAERLNKKDAEMSALQDQLRDVMFYLDAQQTLSTNQDVSLAELQQAQVVIQSNSEVKVQASSKGKVQPSEQEVKAKLNSEAGKCPETKIQTNAEANVQASPKVKVQPIREGEVPASPEVSIQVIRGGVVEPGLSVGGTSTEKKTRKKAR